MIAFIYYRQGDHRFQLITDKLVYFYVFEDGPNGEFNDIPVLEGIMYNFMTCTSLMVDNDSKYSVTYKSGQPNMSIFRRRFDHGFQELFDNTKSREGCRGVNLNSANLFLISDDNQIQIRNEETFKTINTMIVPLQESTTVDAMEILNIKISPNEKYLAVLGGKQLIKEIEEVHSLHIFELTQEGNDFTLLFERNLPEEFRSFAVQF